MKSTATGATNPNSRLGGLFRLVLLFVAVGFGIALSLDIQTQLALTLRIIVLVACTVSVIALLVGFVKFRIWWNEKTRDYWFGRIMWCISGFVGCAESIARHTDFRYGTIFVVVAALVTLKGVLSRGSWGTPKEATKEDEYTG